LSFKTESQLVVIYVEELAAVAFYLLLLFFCCFYFFHYWLDCAIWMSLRSASSNQSWCAFSDTVNLHSSCFQLFI